MTTLNYTQSGRPLVTSPLDEHLRQRAAEQKALLEAGAEPAFGLPPSDQAFSAAHGASSGDEDADLAERIAEMRFRRALNAPAEPWPGACENGEA